MKNVKRTVATVLSALTMTISGTVLAGDAAMHMEFYLEDKVSEQSLVENVELNRSQAIQAPVITSTVKQQPTIDYVATNPVLPKRVYQQRIYSVKSGDTLIKISRKTGVDVLELARLNQIKFKDLDHIQVGQKLKLI